jgi:hypothetical protein
MSWSSKISELQNTYPYTVAQEVQNQFMTCYKYKSVADFDFYLSNNGNYYEYLLMDSPRAFYLDLEFTADNEDDVLPLVNEFVNFTMDILSQFTRYIITPVISISSGIGEKGRWEGVYKHSFHVTFAGCQFNNHSHMKAFYDYLETTIYDSRYIYQHFFYKMNDIIYPIWDDQVYRKNQAMRLLGNSKVGSERIFTLITETDPMNTLITLLTANRYDDIKKDKKSYKMYRRLIVTDESKKNAIELSPDASVKEKIFVIAGNVRQPKYIWELIGKICVYCLEKEFRKVFTEWTLQQERYDTPSEKLRKTQACSVLIDKFLAEIDNDKNEELSIKKYNKILDRLIIQQNKGEYKPFDRKDNYYWGDLLSEMKAVTYPSLGAMVNFLDANLHRVCAVISKGRKSFVLKLNDKELKNIGRQPDPEWIRYVKNPATDTTEAGVSVQNLWTIIYQDSANNWSYSGLKFEPFSFKYRKHECDTLFNTFTEPVANYLKKKQLHLIEPMMGHLKNVICAGNDEWFEYVLDWLASIIQKPFEKTRVCMIWYSFKNQVGKGLFLDWFIQSILGPSLAISSTGTGKITQKHNTVMIGKLFLNLNETYNSESDTNWAATNEFLKTLTTDKTQIVEPKNVDPYYVDLYVNFIITTNRINSIKFEEKRMFALQCDESRADDRDYFNGIAESIKNPMVADVFYSMLMDRDLTSTSIRDFPNTPLMDKMRLQHLPQPDVFMAEILKKLEEFDYGEDSEGLCIKLDNVNTLVTILQDECRYYVQPPLLWEVFKEWSKENFGFSKITKRSFTSRLKEIGYKNVLVYNEGKRQRVYEIIMPSV